MYDFYNNPPTTKAQIKEWLTSWLQKPVPEPSTFEVNGETFIQELGFVRAFYMHCVFRNVNTNEYVWWVSPKDDINYNNFPTKRFPSYESMLEQVINDYHALWNKN